MRARTILNSLPRDTIRDLETLRAALSPEDGSAIGEAMENIEGFCAVALRVMAKTNPSKIRSEAATVEIGMRIAAIEKEKYGTRPNDSQS